nr:PREDICTED: secretory carrier-associated membrane protein 3 [Struthio camelus australis]
MPVWTSLLGAGVSNTADITQSLFYRSLSLRCCTIRLWQTVITQRDKGKDRLHLELVGAQSKPQGTPLGGRSAWFRHRREELYAERKAERAALRSRLREKYGLPEVRAAPLARPPRGYPPGGLKPRGSRSRLLSFVARLNNWPPLPSFCPVKPCFYQDIPVEIPADFQKTVSTMYYLWMASTIALFLNFLTSLAWFCVEPSSGSGFGLSILWALLYTPCSFVCWYRPMYKAFRSDSSFNFFVFFFVFFAQNVMYVLQAIGIPNWGFSGWILSLIALRKNTAVAVMMILVSLCFTAVAVLGIIMLKKIHSLYRRTGASFQKAQEEFAAGVFSNQAVRTAAANAAAGAASNAFRAP